jgi:diaminobutyrate-2-oxoglutarate transaminase
MAGEHCATAVRLSHLNRETHMMMTPEPSAHAPETSIYERRESAVRTYSRSMPRQFDKAQGVWLHDNAGGRYLDFLSGCSSLNYGHNHPVLKAALMDYIAADGVTHALDLHTEAKAAFLHAFEEVILEPRGLDYRAMFTGPTGTNAVEAAIKLARKVTGRELVIAFTNGFHGMTLGALACTGNAGKRGGAGVPLNHVSHEPFDGYYGDEVDTAALLEQRLADPSSGLDAPAAFLVETVQGEGGLNAASPEWLRRIAALAQQHGALLIVDDIQAGCGRTGGFFSFEGMGFTPDIVTLAKSLSGMGLPLALTLMRPEFDVWSPGEHNGTFRGNNHAFVTATAALREFWADPSFTDDVARRGGILETRLERIAVRHRLSTRGRGMMSGIDVGSGEAAAAITRTCFEEGLIIETSGAHDEVVKVLAPLVIDDATFNAGLDILEEAVAAAIPPMTSGTAPRLGVAA